MCRRMSRTGKSFRGVPDAALVRTDATAAILRAEVVDGERTQLLEAEIKAQGRNRVQLNRHPLQRARDLLGLMRTRAWEMDNWPEAMRSDEVVADFFLNGVAARPVSRYS